MYTPVLVQLERYDITKGKELMIIIMNNKVGNKA